MPDETKIKYYLVKANKSPSPLFWELSLISELDTGPTYRHLHCFLFHKTLRKVVPSLPRTERKFSQSSSLDTAQINRFELLIDGLLYTSRGLCTPPCPMPQLRPQLRLPQATDTLGTFFRESLASLLLWMVVPMGLAFGPFHAMKDFSM